LKAWNSQLTRRRSGAKRKIHAFAAARGWIATILDPGIRVTFREVEFEKFTVI
jgi:hypothetical protein